MYIQACGILIIVAEFRGCGMGFCDSEDGPKPTSDGTEVAAQVDTRDLSEGKRLAELV